MTGNPGKRPLAPMAKVIQIAGAVETPEPARPLGQAGMALWARAWRSGRAWLSIDTDLELLQIACEQLDERVALRIRVLRENDGQERQALRQLDKQIIANLSLLGFTPTDRARLGLAEVKAASKLEEIRASQARRVAPKVAQQDHAS